MKWGRKYVELIFFFSLIFHYKSFADQSKKKNETPVNSIPNNRYTYIDREHKISETFKHIAAIYGVSWVLYPLIQPGAFANSGSIKKYRRNFGNIVFDKDEPFWNWFVHPISGSQLYLYYRANGYNKTSSVALAFASSALFELTIEVYTEPASIQDLYQTPILGSIFGFGIEHLSMYLLNSETTFGRVVGHAINPATLFWFYEGRTKILPQTDLKTWGGLKFVAEF